MKFKKGASKGKMQPKNRKEIRKEQRKLKKVRKHEYYTNRKKPGQYVLNPNKNAVDDTKIDNKKTEPSSAVDEQIDRLRKERTKQEKLQKEMQRQRKRQLKEANMEEDRTIKKLEKQLKLDKKKAAIPKLFASDGLDYLLEVCDSEMMQGAVLAEQQLAEANDEFEEDFALMTGISKSAKAKRQSVKSRKEFGIKSDSQMDLSANESDSNEDFSDTDQSALEGNQQNDNFDDFSDLYDSAPEGTKCDTDLEDFSDESNKYVQKQTKQKHKNDDKTNDMSDNESWDQSDGDDMDDDKTNNASSAKDNKEVWEDIYGRLRTKDGSVLELHETKLYNLFQSHETKYVPPAVRNQQDKKIDRLKKQLKGLLNRLAESNMHSISTQIEELYMNNSRNDMNDTLTQLIFEALITPTRTPDRLLLEHVLLITILHANIGAEVGAHFLQAVVKKFDELFEAEQAVENKMLDNTTNIIAQMYNFRLFNARLLYQILRKLSSEFTEKHIECVLLILKSVGFTLRKDDPLALKDLILELQKQATESNDKSNDNSRVKFMLDILLAIKNNNVTKIPNYDTTYSEHLKKLLKGFVRKGNYVTQLNISLEDLSKADERGKWWIVGSAWTGNELNQKDDQEKQSETYSSKLLRLAKKQHMNTDTRRNIFCIIMTAEDYLDAFEKLMRLDLKNQQEREIINVILHCSLQERNFNPYYAYLTQKFCDYDRKYQITIKYSIWDKLKTLTECSADQISNLAKLLIHLFIEKGLPISTLKVMEFGELDKITLRFIRQILLGILLHDDTEAVEAVFMKVSQSDKLKMFRESLRLFLHHFLLKNLKAGVVPEHKGLLESRAKAIEKILVAKDSRTRL